VAQTSQTRYSVLTAAGSDPVRDGGKPVLGILENVAGMAFDASGNLYLADSVANRIRKVTPDVSQDFPEGRYANGLITTYAGVGAPGFLGDDGPASEARINRPGGIAVDSSGNVYIADTGNRRVRWVDSAGVMHSLDLGPLGVMTAMAMDAEGYVNFIDVATSNGIGAIKRINGDAAAEVRYVGLRSPIALAFGPDNAAYVIETSINRVSRIEPDGSASRPLDLPMIPVPRALAFDRAGALYVADGGTLRIYKVDLATMQAAPILPPLSAAQALAFDPQGNLAVGFQQQINLWVPGQTAFGAPVIGEQNLRDRVGRAATETLFYRPLQAVVNPDGDLVAASPFSFGVRKVRQTTGIVENVPGSERAFAPGGILPDPRDGSLLVGDMNTQQLFRIGAEGSVQVIAGVGRPGDSGDGGPASEAQLLGPAAMTWDAAGNLYLQSGNRVRKIDAATGIITAFAPGPVSGLARGEDGSIWVANLVTLRKYSTSGELLAQLDIGASGIAVDDKGQLILARGHAIFRMSPSATTAAELERIAGQEVPGFAGDGAHALEAQFNNPGPLWFDAATGAILVTDRNNHRIRKLVPLQ